MRCSHAVVAPFVFMGVFDIFRKKSLPMVGVAKGVERSADGDYWYLSSLLGSGLKRCKDIDMRSVGGKRDALLCCTPLFTVVDKAGMMMGRGVPYVVDKNGNEKPRYQEIKALLDHPNPLQTFSSFVKQIEISLKVFGYCPIVMVRGSQAVSPKAMWIVPAELFHAQGSGKVFRQFELKEIVERCYVSWGGREIDIEDYELVLITDCQMVLPSSSKSDILFECVTDGLTQAVNNWVASMAASHTLLVNGGPKGIVYSDYADEMGNVALTAEDEKRIKDTFKERYGLVGKEYPILVSRNKLGWIPLDYNSDQLKLYDEDARCTEKICNAIGLNPNLFTDAKYDNQESAKKSAYQDVIIPDSKKIAEALTKALCPEGAFIKIDFSDVECLQANKAQESETLTRISQALVTLMGANLITPDEARIEVSRYMDIDPDKPVGEFMIRVERVNDKEGKEDGEV